VEEEVIRPITENWLWSIYCMSSPSSVCFYWAYTPCYSYAVCSLENFKYISALYASRLWEKPRIFHRLHSNVRIHSVSEK